MERNDTFRLARRCSDTGWMWTKWNWWKFSAFEALFAAFIGKRFIDEPNCVSLLLDWNPWGRSEVTSRVKSKTIDFDKNFYESSFSLSKLRQMRTSRVRSFIFVTKLNLSHFLHPSLLPSAAYMRKDWNNRFPENRALPGEINKEDSAAWQWWPSESTEFGCLELSSRVIFGRDRKEILRKIWKVENFVAKANQKLKFYANALRNQNVIIPTLQALEFPEKDFTNFSRNENIKASKWQLRM